MKSMKNHETPRCELHENIKKAKWIRKQSKLLNIVEINKMLKWNWAGHIMRTNDYRWTKRLIGRTPYDKKAKPAKSNKGVMNYLNLTQIGLKRALIVKNEGNWGRPFSCSGANRLLLMMMLQIEYMTKKAITIRDVEAEAGSIGSGKFSWKRKLEAVKGHRFRFHFGHSYRTPKLKGGAIKNIYIQQKMNVW